ncbi:phage antirepressor KilAC domain-containing protein [Aureibacillus halotolerans]|uniref:Prophage antirepressor-like protein n=1 Tax=Aureibacillus halotolerans TaxID=1508390 RepID=A0A4R6TRG0_9BACI|nr:phage antirepressor KilAC domain-containing protein [Aureibacillus halotolerans]TDQ35262.1 prophage antirepressor-like protein [Aureibacillus halotolerans]
MDQLEKVFDFDGHNVRTCLIDGKPWIVAKDVADILDFRDTNAMTRHLDDDESIHVQLTGMNMKSTLVSESALYYAVLRSKKPEAKQFRRWVTDEVLPSIRKTGSYESKPSYMIDDPIERAQQWINEQQKVKLLEQKAAEYQKKAAYVDQILMSKSTVTTTQIAKDYGMSGQQMNRILHEQGVQYKQSGQWLLYSKHHDQGYTKSSTIDIVRSDGRPDVTMNTKWTQKGRLFIHRIMEKMGYNALVDKKEAVS